MNLFNSLPIKILPQTPSACIATIASEEAIEILDKYVAQNRPSRRKSLNKMKITSVNQSIAYKYILNRYELHSLLQEFVTIYL